MKKITPDPPSFTLHDAAQCSDVSLDRAAAERALDFYLLDPKPPRHVDQATYVLHGGGRHGAGHGIQKAARAPVQQGAEHQE